MVIYHIKYRQEECKSFSTEVVCVWVCMTIPIPLMLRNENNNYILLKQTQSKSFSFVWLCFWKTLRNSVLAFCVLFWVTLAAFQYLLFYVCCVHKCSIVLYTDVYTTSSNTVIALWIVCFRMRRVKIRHSCNFPVVSCAINQADAWLRWEDGFCVVFICFTFLPRSSSPHLVFFLFFLYFVPQCQCKMLNAIWHLKQNEIKEWARIFFCLGNRATSFCILFQFRSAAAAANDSIKWKTR